MEKTKAVTLDDYRKVCDYLNAFLPADGILCNEIESLAKTKDGYYARLIDSCGKLVEVLIKINNSYAEAIIKRDGIETVIKQVVVSENYENCTNTYLYIVNGVPRTPMSAISNYNFINGFRPNRKDVSSIRLVLKKEQK